METVKFTMRLPKNLFEKLRTTALKAQLKRKLDNKPRTMGGIIIKALEEYLGVGDSK